MGVILDVGRYRAQRCQGCGKRFWVERRPKATCPACGGELHETEERRRETKGGFASRKDCQAALTRKLTTLAENTYVLPSRLSLREFLEGLAAGDRKRRAPDDTLRLSHAGRATPRAAAGGSAAAEPQRRADQRPLRQAAQGRPGAWFRWPLPQHRASRPCRVASGPARRRQVGLPADQCGPGADPPRASAQHTELAVWSEEQLHAFLDSVADQRLYPLWRFLAMTGCRRGEALGLTWRDLDIEGGRVAIVRALVPIDGKLCRDEPKTKRGRRLIALDAETVAVLRQQAAGQLRAAGAGR